MPKNPKKQSNNLLQLCIYGIWSRKKKKIVFISLKQDDAELEFDMEGYTDETHSMIRMETVYDTTSLVG